MSRSTALLDRDPILPLEGLALAPGLAPPTEETDWLADLLERSEGPPVLDSGEPDPVLECTEHRWRRGTAVFDHAGRTVEEYHCPDCGLTEYVTSSDELPRDGGCR